MKYHRKSIRLNDYDYSSNGYYFVTVCANWKGNVFGEIVGARRDAPIINKNNNLPINNKNYNSSMINENNNHLCNIEINKSVEIKLNQNGKIIKNVWKTLPNHHNVILDEFIVMPDHVHFILAIKNDINQGVSRRAPTHLGFIIGMFKTECTKQISKLNKTLGIRIFQRNYYERIIRNEKEYLIYKKYIRDNPVNFDNKKIPQNGGF